MKKIILLVLVAVILLGIAYWATQKPSETAPLTTADFVLADTAAVGKVVITDTEGGKVVVARGTTDQWMVNDKFRAREDAIELILKTLHLLEIKHPVGAKSRENTIRMMSGRHTYVQVFDRKGKAMKAYYVGLMTPDQQGTYMVLELPDRGRVEVPYVMTMKAFYGYLTSRFFTNELDWRDRTIIHYPELQFERVEVANHLHPERSMAIEFDGRDGFQLFRMPEEQQVAHFDTARVKDFLLLYKKASCETYELAYNQHQVDSVLSQNPDFEIKIDGRGDANDTHLRLFLRPPVLGEENDDGTPAEYSREIMDGTLDGKEMFRVQRYVIDKLLQPIQAFEIN